MPNVCVVVVAFQSVSVFGGEEPTRSLPCGFWIAGHTGASTSSQTSNRTGFVASLLAPSLPLLLGRMLHNGDGFYFGAEVAGSAQIPKDENGMRTTLELGVDILTPLVYRHIITNTYIEFEGAWLGHATEKDWGDVDNGVHVGIAFGGRALRQRFLFPGAALAIAYERLFLDGDDQTTLKVGARVEFDWDL